jgi:hypothetical protein
LPYGVTGRLKHLRVAVGVVAGEEGLQGIDHHQPQIGDHRGSLTDFFRRCPEVEHAIVPIDR